MAKKKKKTVAVIKLKKIKISSYSSDFPLWIERVIAEFRRKKDARRMGLA